MIDIARDVVATASINRPSGVDRKEVLAIQGVNNLVGHKWPGIFDNFLALGNRGLSYQT